MGGSVHLAAAPCGGFLREPVILGWTEEQATSQMKIAFLGCHSGDVRTSQMNACHTAVLLWPLPGRPVRARLAASKRSLVS